MMRGSWWESRPGADGALPVVPPHFATPDGAASLQTAARERLSGDPDAAFAATGGSLGSGGAPYSSPSSRLSMSIRQNDQSTWPGCCAAQGRATFSRSTDAPDEADAA